MLHNVTQNDSEYTAAIAMDAKRDSIAMRTISILGIIYLPATFVATLFSMDMIQWGGSDGEESSLPKASPSLWVYWATALPLTFTTILIWFLWSRRENQTSSERLKSYRATVPKAGDASIVMSNLVSLGPGEKMV